MTRQDLVHVEQQIERFIEGDLMPAQQADAAVAADPLQCGLDGGRIDGVGAHALESEEHGAIRAMPAAGQRQRAIQLRGHLRGALGSSPRASNNRTKLRAAFIGPMVCELEGPMPILKMSKTLKLMRGILRPPVGC